VRNLLLSFSLLAICFTLSFRIRPILAGEGPASLPHCHPEPVRAGCEQCEGPASLFFPSCYLLYAVIPNPPHFGGVRNLLLSRLSSRTRRILAREESASLPHCHPESVRVVCEQCEGPASLLTPRAPFPYPDSASGPPARPRKRHAIFRSSPPKCRGRGPSRAPLPRSLISRAPFSLPRFGIGAARKIP
jgi:hypothetical protein